VSADEEKQLAADAASELVEEGMRVGLGTGTTVAFLIASLARRAPDVRYVATSLHTEVAARTLGLVVEPFDTFDELDIAIDGADQIASDGWLMKGGGGAQLRERIVAAAARHFIVIADSSKRVAALHAPVPLELNAFGLQATLRELGSVRLRDVGPSPDGGVIADYYGELSEPAELSLFLAATPGVAAHGLFEPDLVSEIIVGTGRTVTRSIPGGTR
jgi:ribose 5-phosphate isomerase A